MNQAADAGNNQNRRERERIEPEGNVEIEAANVEPAPKIVEHEALSRREFEHPDKSPGSAGEGGDDGAAGNDAHRPMAEPLLDRATHCEIKNRARERKQNDPANKGDG